MRTSVQVHAHVPWTHDTLILLLAHPLGLHVYIAQVHHINTPTCYGHAAQHDLAEPYELRYLAEPYESLLVSPYANLSCTRTHPTPPLTVSAHTLQQQTIRRLRSPRARARARAHTHTHTPAVDTVHARRQVCRGFRAREAWTEGRLLATHRDAAASEVSPPLPFLVEQSRPRHPGQAGSVPRYHSFCLAIFA